MIGSHLKFWIKWKEIINREREREREYEREY